MGLLSDGPRGFDSRRCRQKFKKLIERDQAKGDPEPEDDEDLAAAAATAAEEAAKAVTVDADGNTIDREEALLSEALQDGQADLPPSKKVRPQTVSRLKALLKEPDGLIGDDVSKQADVHVMLGYLLIKRGDEADAIPILRRALRLDAERRGLHQALAQALTKRAPFTRHDGSDAFRAALAEVTSLYEQGTALVPEDAESFYQLGRMLNMDPAVARGGAKDGATRAWKRALAVKPEMVECHQVSLPSSRLVSPQLPPSALIPMRSSAGR